jgi:ABC-type proline/glycine betaine transport system ATPase subunit
MSLLTDKQKEEIQKLTDEVLKEAELVVKDYEDNPSEMSGSTQHIHFNSPVLDD